MVLYPVPAFCSQVAVTTLASLDFISGFLPPSGSPHPIFTLSPTRPPAVGLLSLCTLVPPGEGQDLKVLACSTISHHGCFCQLLVNSFGDICPK